MDSFSSGFHTFLFARRTLFPLLECEALIPFPAPEALPQLSTFPKTALALSPF